MLLLPQSHRDNTCASIGTIAPRLLLLVVVKRALKEDSDVQFFEEI